MAKVKISDLTAAAALDGTELIEGEQDGGSVKMTAQDIADLAGSSGVITQTVTGTAETPIIIYADIPIGTHLFTLTWKAVCSVQGNGTTVEGEGLFNISLVPATSSDVNASWNDLLSPAIEDTSFAGSNWSVDVNGGDLRFLFTPPSSAGSTTQIIVSVKVEVL